jgi:hypothetical protein
MSVNLKARKAAMKYLPVILAGLFAVAPAAAQFGARSGALGGGFASRGMSRPLGGIPPGFTGLGPNRNFNGRNFNGNQRRPLVGYPYAYSVWVPDSFDYLSYQNQYAAPYGYGASYGPPPAAPGYYESPGAGAQGPQQPVIINQYFGAQGPQQVNAPETTSSNTQAPGDVIGTPQNYYLIAYKNHAIYAALAYWLEDKTLHYVTTQNTHNQASLDLIDVNLTKSLNQEREIPFSIAGQ